MKVRVLRHPDAFINSAPEEFVALIVVAMLTGMTLVLSGALDLGERAIAALL